MITFRFYIVSVVAFFLALAVGVVLGSALDGRISDSLKDRLEKVESNLDSTVDLIDLKNDEIDQLNTYADASVPFAVEGRLEGTSTLIVAQSGINEDQLADLVAAVRLSGSTTPGVLWVDKSWDLKSKDFISRAQTALGGSTSLQAGDKAGERLWGAVLEVLGVDMSGPGDTTTTVPTTTLPGETTLPVDTAPTSTVLPVSNWWEQPLIDELAENSVLRLETIGQVAAPQPGAVLNVIAVMGPDSEVGNGNSDIGSLAKVASDVGVPVVVAEFNSATDEADSTGADLKAMIAKFELKDLSVAQSADEVSGRVATVVALQQAGEGTFGTYGRGTLSSSLLPKPLSPDGGS